MTTKLRFRRVPATVMRRTSSRWLSRRSGLNRTKGFSDLSWPVAKYWTIKRILACGLCVVLTFCKFSQFQFGWLQYLLSQIEYKFLGPSSLMSLCVWPFQTTVRLCEDDYYYYLHGSSKPLYVFAKLTTNTTYFYYIFLSQKTWKRMFLLSPSPVHPPTLSIISEMAWKHTSFYC